MRAAITGTLLLLLAACATVAPVVKPVPEGGNRADGIVTMSSVVSMFEPSAPDWRAAEDGTVARRCQRWGYRGGQTFTGWREDCRVYRHGRCAAAQIRRYYQCEA